MTILDKNHSVHSELRWILRKMGPGYIIFGGQTFGGQTFGGRTFGGQTFGGQTFGGQT